ncbi:MAG: histidine kinase [Rubrivivax sp.]|nr:histidine kinase [Rubrivivax sp.]
MPAATATDFPPHPLEQPLPVALTGRAGGWLSAYRRYPVFSAAWMRGRWRLLAAVLVPVLLLSYPLFFAAPQDRPYGGLLATAIEVLIPALLGPWLGWRVRRRQWPPRREGWGLAGAVAVAMLASVGFELLLAEPLKQKVAEMTGAVDEQGKRRRVAMIVGVTVATPESGASAPAPPPGAYPRDQRFVLAVNVTSRAAAGFLLAGGLGLFGWRRERRGLQSLARERALVEAESRRREAELRLSVLAAQVEPHFLFNTLAGVRSAIGTDPARASEMIDRLVDYLRAAIPRLRSDGGSAATLAGQLDIVRAYLSLMAARMPRLHWTIDVAPDLLAAPYPPLMLISLVENAVKHGVEPKIGPVHVEVRAARTADGRLEITVADDGAGFGASASGGGLGLANIRERLQQMFGERAAFVLKARPEGGVAAILTLPME